MDIQIDKKSLDLRAADWIRDAIASGRLPLGQKLTEIALAEQIGLSRSTVRTAMQRLAGEGFLVQLPYTGWQVMSLSPEDAWELHTLRTSLEGMAARLAAERIDDKGHQALCAALERLRRAVERPDAREIAEADLNVHKTVVMVAQHRRLAALYTLVSGPTLLYILSTNRMMERPEAILPEHEAVVAAILAGDADQAEHLAKEHVNVHGQRLVATLKKHKTDIAALDHTESV